MRIQRLAMFLEAHFGEVELHMPDASEAEEEELAEDEDAREREREPSFLVSLDDTQARIGLITLVSFPLLPLQKSNELMVWISFLINCRLWIVLARC